MNKSNIIFEAPQLSGLKLFYDVINPDGCQLAGMLGEVTEYLLVEPILEAGYNCTLVTRVGKDVINGADISYFDIPGSDNKVVLLDTSLAIVSVYNSNIEVKKQDLLGLFFGLEQECYILLFFIFFVFSFIWSYLEMITRKMKHESASKFVQTRKSGLWLMLCALLDEDQYPDIAIIAFKIIGFCFTFFFWVVIDQYLMDIIGTDMVVFKEPPVVRSYQDFIDQDRYMIQIPWVEEAAFFSDARKGTLEEIIGRRTISVPSVLEDLSITMLHGFMNGSYATWMRRDGAKFVGSYMSANGKMLGIENYRGLIYPDKSNKTITYSFKYKSGFRFEEKFLDRFRKSFESGILKYILEDGISTGGGEFPYSDPNMFSSQVMHDDMPLPYIELSMLFRFLIALAFLIAISCVVLIREIKMSKKNKVAPPKNVIFVKTLKTT